VQRRRRSHRAARRDSDARDRSAGLPARPPGLWRQITSSPILT
jgi:hypothetical protein